MKRSFPRRGLVVSRVLAKDPVAPRTPERCRQMRRKLTCSICHDLLIKTVILSECGHAFCDPCLRQWLPKSRTCPECRAEVKSEPTRCRVFDGLVEHIVPESPTGTRVRRVTEWNARPDQPPILNQPSCLIRSPVSGWMAEYASAPEGCECCGLEIPTGAVALVKRAGTTISRFRLRCCKRQLCHSAFNLRVDTRRLRPLDVAEFRSIPLSV
jgi:hypothetical protein